MCRKDKEKIRLTRKRIRDVLKSKECETENLLEKYLKRGCKVYITINHHLVNGVEELGSHAFFVGTQEKICYKECSKELLLQSGAVRTTHHKDGTWAYFGFIDKGY
jgi:porphobilinogen deaminase